MVIPEEEEARGTRYLAKCVLRGSVVLHAVYGHIRSPSTFDVVFGKETSMELVIIGEDGIVQSVCEQTVFGTIKGLDILRWNGRHHAPLPQTNGKDLLVVLSDSGKLSFLTFNIEMHRFFAVTHIQLSQPGNSRHQLGRMLAVDSNGAFVAVSAYEDQLALFSVSISAGSNIVDKKILYPPELKGDTGTGRDSQKSSISGTIWSICFISKVLHSSKEAYNPMLAMILHRRGAVQNELLFLECDTRENNVHVISQYNEAGPLALNIVEIPHLPGFAFLFRIGDALLMDIRDPHNPCCTYRTCLNIPNVIDEKNSAGESCRSIDPDDEGIFNVAASALLELRDSGMDVMKGDDPMNLDVESGKVNQTSKFICSWSWEPSNLTNPKLIFCLNTGELYILDIYFDNQDGIKVRLSDCLYRDLNCKTLLWVKGSFIATLIEMGDGLVLKLEDGKLLYQSPIQNIAPILDISVVDYHNEKQDQMFACCGKGREGSLRIIRSGISVEKLLRTAPIYQGITGTWTVRMKKEDPYHSFLVLSFVEETRVLSVGLSFFDVTDAVGFQSDACTLACGLMEDGVLVQIHRNAVRLCLPSATAHSGGIPLIAPISTSWVPDNLAISLGAVGHGLIIVATSNPCFLFILGARSLSALHYVIYEIQRVRLLAEVSCISIPLEESVESAPVPDLIISSGECSNQAALPFEIEIGKTFVIGTHKPSVELFYLSSKEGFRVVAVGAISLTNTMGAAISGCIPQDVRLVLVDRFYILSGLRNGMLLRFEWPAISATFPSELSNPMDAFLPSMTAPFAIGNLPLQNCAVNMEERLESSFPVQLQLISVRRIGITPAFLVPLCESLHADIIALSDRPWLLQTARHSLAYTSISFQAATHATPVCSVECPKGILFVAENSLHLVEMVHTKRLNVQKFYLGSTPRRVLYHAESRTLLVMRTDSYSDLNSTSDICCIDPLSGSLLSAFNFDAGEMAKCMQLVKVGNEQVLVVGTSRSAGRAIMPSGEAESSEGRLLVFSLERMQDSDSGSKLFCTKSCSAGQLSSPFREVVGYATEQVSGSSSLCRSPDDSSCDGMKLEGTEAWQLRLVWQTILPGVVLSVCPYLDHYFLASAGNIFYIYGFLNENPQRLRRFASGRTRFTITCITAYLNRIAVGDCRDGILFYSYQEGLRKLEHLYCDPVHRLVADCVLIDLDTAVVSDRRGNICVLSCPNHLEDNGSPECNLMLSCSYYMGETVMSIRKGSFSYKLPVDDVLKSCDGSETQDFANMSVVASTLLGSVIIFIPISREVYDQLEAVQARLVTHPLTAPILGNDHNEFRGRGSPGGVARILDGDMLTQFLELTSMQQEAVMEASDIPVSRVVRLLERLHYALN